MSNFQEILKGIQLCEAFSQLSDEEKEQLALLGTIEKYKKDDILFTFEHTGDAFFIVLSGKLRALLRTSQKKKFSPGHLFGEVSIFEGRNRTGIIRATEHSTLIRFEKKDIYETEYLEDKFKLNITLALTRHIVSYFYDNPVNVRELIKKGESETLEFKESVHEKNYEKILQTIVAMCNHKGGTILVGVKDDKTVVGADFNMDKLMVDLEGIAQNKLGNILLSLIHIFIEPVGQHNIIRIECEPSDNLIFWDTDGRDILFVRGNAMNRELDTVKDIVNYLQKRLKK